MDFKDRISYEKMIEIFDDGVEMGVKAIELTGGGEPSLHPHFVGILKAIRSRGFDLGLITNGIGKSFQRDRDEVIELLSRAKWVRFSVNGGSPESHTIVHRARRTDFHNILRNISLLVNAKSKDTTVGISFIVQPENHKEIPRITEIANDLGVDYLRIAPAIFSESTKYSEVYKDYYPPEIRSYVEADLRKIKAEEQPGDTGIIDVFSPRLGFKDQQSHYETGDFCYISNVMAVIGADQRLYPCCVWKYRPDGEIGNLKEMGLKELWESEQRAQYYRDLDISKMCISCFYKPRNDFIQDLVDENMTEHEGNPDFIQYRDDPEPLHINFI